MNFTLKKSDLNFKVYIVASKPTTPGAENDIAIISSVPMTNWIMSPEKPSGIPRNDGDVWIQYSTSGDTRNILKQNALMIATIFAWQYVDGAWVDREAVSCQGGAWVDWWDGYIYNRGDLCENVTGGWGEIKAGTSTITWNDGGVEVKTLHSEARYCTTYTKKAINIDGRSKLYVVVSNLSFASGGSVGIGLIKTPNLAKESDTTNFFAVSIQITSTTSNNQLLEVPISGLKGTGPYYVQIASRLANVTVHETYVK